MIWWFLIVALSLLTVGVFDEPLRPGRGAHWTLILLTLTLLLWFLGEWLLFAVRVCLVVPAVRLTDIFARPDPRSGQIALTIIVRNDDAADHERATVSEGMSVDPAADTNVHCWLARIAAASTRSSA